MSKYATMSAKFIDNRHKLSQAAKTKEDAILLITMLETILSNLAQDKDPANIYSDVLPPAKIKLLEDDLKETTSKEVRLLLQSIIKEIKQTPTATIELAFSPSANFTQKLVEETTALLSEPVIIEIKTKPEIGAGLIIYYQGRVYDYSIKNKVDEVKI